MTEADLAGDRLVALIDMDCFYVQVEQRERPELLGKPVAVVQYNRWKGGGLIAVSYEARANGVKRGSMRGDDAKLVCPDIQLVSVPTTREKADLSKYRMASEEVMKVLTTFDSSITVERASVDEAYLDLTKSILSRMREWDMDSELNLSAFPTTFVCDGEDKTEGYDRERGLNYWFEDGCLKDPAQLMLALATETVERIRAEIYSRTGFRCSAGIAVNKMLAKLICSRHKPNRQTVLPSCFLEPLFNETKITSVRNLGGKLGSRIVERFNITTMSELAAVPAIELQNLFGHQKIAEYLLNLANGLDDEEVKARDLPQSIGCSKNFMGRSALAAIASVERYLGLLCDELAERLDKDRSQNMRTARTLTVGGRTATSDGGGTRQTPLRTYDRDAIFRDSLQLLSSFNTAAADGESWYPPLTNVHVSAGKFQDTVDLVQSRPITDFFTVASSSGDKTGETTAATITDDHATTSDRCEELSSTDNASLLDEPDAESTCELIEEEEPKTQVCPNNDSFAGLFENLAGSSVVAQAVVDTNAYYPDSIEDMDTTVYRDLPPSIQFELRAHFRRRKLLETTPGAQTSDVGGDRVDGDIVVLRTTTGGKPKHRVTNNNGKKKPALSEVKSRKITSYFGRSS